MLKKRFITAFLLSTLVFISLSTEVSGNADKKVTISISAVGDCTLGSFPEVTKGKSFFDVFNNQNKDFSYFFRNATALKHDDLSIINLEGTFTTSSKIAKKKWRFKSDPEFVNILKSASVEAAVISNNHSHDYGAEGFSDTVKTLQSAGIPPIGESYKPVLDIKNKKIALLSYNVLSNAYVESELKKDINRASKNSDLIIVSFHWGIEYTYKPLPIEQALAKKAIDMGADLVLGTHPHVLQGIEQYHNRYILYSLGNFVFGGNEIMNDEKHKDLDTFLFTQNFTFKGEEIIPEVCKIGLYHLSGDRTFNDYCPVKLKEAEALKVRDKILELSKSLLYGIKSIHILP